MGIQITTTKNIDFTNTSNAQQISKNKTDPKDEIKKLINAYSQALDNAFESAAAKEMLHYYCTPRKFKVLEDYFNENANKDSDKVIRSVTEHIDYLKIDINTSTTTAKTEEILVETYKNRDIKTWKTYKTYHIIKQENNWYIDHTENNFIGGQDNSSVQQVGTGNTATSKLSTTSWIIIIVLIVLILSMLR